MHPFPPPPPDTVSANLRRAYRGTLPAALPDDLARLLVRLAERTSPPATATRRPAPPARRETVPHRG